MRKEQRDVIDLGGFGTIRESFKLFWIHPKTFLLILFIFIVPVVILVAVLFYFELSLVLDIIYTPTRLARVFPDWISGAHSFLVLVWTPVISILVVAQIAQGLSLSTIFYAVGLIYTGKAVSFRNVVRAAIPRLWWRVTVTYLYMALINSTIIAIVNIVGQPYDCRDCNLTFRVNHLLVSTSFTILLFYLGITGIHLARFSIEAAGVSVFEEEYGWAAFAKGYQLMKGKEWVKWRFGQLSSWPNTVVILLIVFFYYQSFLSPMAIHDSPSTWSRRKLLLGLIVGSAWTSVYLFFQQLGMSVIYVSCKATHDEKIEDSYLFGDRPKSDGYEAIEDLEAEKR